jgi:hypothetical protein
LPSSSFRYRCTRGAPELKRTSTWNKFKEFSLF